MHDEGSGTTCHWARRRIGSEHIIRSPEWGGKVKQRHASTMRCEVRECHIEILGRRSKHGLRNRWDIRVTWERYREDPWFVYS